jgi:acetylornithine deacetylase/succinyl-diaminopimelate desuccinylase-like protein
MVSQFGGPEVLQVGEKAMPQPRSGEVLVRVLAAGVGPSDASFFSFSTSDEKLHAPNECLRIRRLLEGMRAWERLWRLLAVGPHRLAAPAGEPNRD